MNLTPREKDKLLIAMAAIVARRRLERGVKLNHPEAVALITDFVADSRCLSADLGDPAVVADAEHSAGSHLTVSDRTGPQKRTAKRLHGGKFSLPYHTRSNNIGFVVGLEEEVIAFGLPPRPIGRERVGARVY